MVFSSITFIFYFLPLVLSGYFLTPDRYKNYTLLVASLVFYYIGEPIYILLMLSSVTINYIYGRLIESYKGTKISRGVLSLAVTTNLLILGIFKYFNFFAENFSALLNIDVKWTEIALPIGISFYTFQIMSYIIDVARGEVKAQRNIAYLALYVSLFPQLIAGPIVRYKTIEEELKNRKHSYDNFAYGVKRFAVGLLKKVVIANQLGELWNLAKYSDQPSVLIYWLGAVGFMLQIYYDFSAYSDMGIGMGRMFGFHFLENFNYPYVSKSITEFWKRWHMSLGSWFRDYLYIPLGGNRTSKLGWYRNIALVWLATGIWHGAAWNFMLWGACFGVLLILEKHFILGLLNRVPKVIGHVYTLLIILFSFVLFNSGNLTDAAEYMQGMLGFSELPWFTREALYHLGSNKVLLILAALGSAPLFPYVAGKLKSEHAAAILFSRISHILEPAFIVILLVTATGFIIDASFNPFLYFRF